MLKLSELGERICIMGPSNSGKSTLADAVARKIGVQAVHLDILQHLPQTDWEPRPFEDFQALHDRVIDDPGWVIDGNYSKLLPQRIARASGLILLDISTPLSLFRYVRRCLFHHNRIGGLAGGKDSVKWDMLKHIVTATRDNRRRYGLLPQTIQLPSVLLTSSKEIARCYMEWGLSRKK